MPNPWNITWAHHWNGLLLDLNSLKVGLSKFIGNSQNTNLLNHPWCLDLQIICKPTFITVVIHLANVNVVNLLQNQH